jgi:hypothetical protein
MRSVLAVTCAVAGLLPAAASAQVTEPPFDSAYTVRDLGQPPGVPPRLGGLTVLAGDANTLLIGGEANASTGALYTVPLARNADGHITGFSGTATRFADAAYNDGGVAYGPGRVLFLARWPNNELGQTKPGSQITDKIIDMSTHGVASSLVALGFVPAGFPGAGSLKLSSYGGGEWYDAEFVADGSGTYDLRNVTEVPASQLPGSDGFVFVPPGSRLFDGPSMLVSEYTSDAIGAYAIDGDGNPVASSRRTFMTGLDGAVGATIDPVTNDFLFSTFGGGDHVVAVRGFGSQDTAPPPELGKTVTASVVKGEVLIKLPSGSARASQKGTDFVPLTEARSIPVRSILDTTGGTVALRSARNRAGKTQSGKFSDGVFQVLQSRKRRAKGLTELRLKGSAAEFRRCDDKSGSGSAKASLTRRQIRRLRARARGRYRTGSRYSAATVRGTTWTVTDRCDGTLTTVKRGKVAVRDFRLQKTIVVGAGKQYLAAP